MTYQEKVNALLDQKIAQLRERQIKSERPQDIEDYIAEIERSRGYLSQKVVKITATSVTQDFEKITAWLEDGNVVVLGPRVVARRYNVATIHLAPQKSRFVGRSLRNHVTFHVRPGLARPQGEDQVLDTIIFER